MARTAFVRVAEPHFNFIKENISGDPEEGYERISVHGFDELGDPVCPIFEVPYVQPVTHAIHEEKILGFNEDDGKPFEKYAGRLVEVDATVVDQFPKWIGHPTPQMSVEEIVNTVLDIREQQLKGDKILGRTRKPYRLDPMLFKYGDEVDKVSYNKAMKLLEEGKHVEIPENPQPATRKVETPDGINS